MRAAGRPRPSRIGPQGIGVVRVVLARAGCQGGASGSNVSALTCCSSAASHRPQRLARADRRDNPKNLRRRPPPLERNQPPLSPDRRHQRSSAIATRLCDLCAWLFKPARIPTAAATTRAGMMYRRLRLAVGSPLTAGRGCVRALPLRCSPSAPRRAARRSSNCFREARRRLAPSSRSRVNSS
jgi:hypothetical protein